MNLGNFGFLQSVTYNLINNISESLAIRWPELVEIQRNGNNYSLLQIEKLQVRLNDFIWEQNLYPTSEIGKTTDSQYKYINSLISEFVQLRYQGVVCYMPSTLNLYFYKGA